MAIVDKEKAAVTICRLNNIIFASNLLQYSQRNNDKALSNIAHTCSKLYDVTIVNVLGTMEWRLFFIII